MAVYAGRVGVHGMGRGPISLLLSPEISRKTGKRWLTALIQKMWKVAWDLWEHRNGVRHEQENFITEVKQAEQDHELNSLL